MGDLQIFNFDGCDLRVLVGDDGKPRWVLADLARVLRYRDAATAGRVLRDRHRGTHLVRTPGGLQQMTVVDEPGLYRLVMRSNQPDAERFQDWVTDEVLPSIRKTGTYAIPAGDPATDHEVALVMLCEANARAVEASRGRLEEYRGRKLAEAKVVALEAVVVELEPKAALADAVVENGDHLDLDVAAAQLSNDPVIGRFRRKDLVAWLLRQKWLYRRGKAGRLHVMRSAYDAGFMDVRYGEPWGGDRRTATPLVTALGLAFAMEKLRAERAPKQLSIPAEHLTADQMTAMARTAGLLGGEPR